MEKVKSVAFLLTHPIQYYAPLFRYLTVHANFKLTVFYQSCCSATEYYDVEFHRCVTWDTDLLSGYKYELLPSFGRDNVLSSWRPFSHGLSERLRAGHFDAFFVIGYGRVFHAYAMLAGYVFGVRTYLRDDATLQSKKRSPIKQFLKHGGFGVLKMLGIEVLAAGTLNRDYFLAQGFRPSQIHPMRWAVDCDYFRQIATCQNHQIPAVRDDLRLRDGQMVYLFVGKFSERKGIVDLLTAFYEAHRHAAAKPALLFIGDGALREMVEAACRQCEDIKLIGFKNQSELAIYYRLSDILILPSKTNETWGLVVNEAMSVGTPAILSDHVGCHRDLIVSDKTGWVFREGDIEALTRILINTNNDPKAIREMRDHCLEMSGNYTYSQNQRELETVLA